MSGRLITCVEVLVDLWTDVRLSQNGAPCCCGATDVPTVVETFVCSTVVVPSILLIYSAVKLSIVPKVVIACALPMNVSQSCG